MEPFSALMAICAGNSPVPGEFPTQRPVTRSFDVYFDLCPNKRLSKKSWGWWFETASCLLWRHRNDMEPRMHIFAMYFQLPCETFGHFLFQNTESNCMRTVTWLRSNHTCYTLALIRAINWSIPGVNGYRIYRWFSTRLWYLQCVSNGILHSCRKPPRYVMH